MRRTLSLIIMGMVVIIVSVIFGQLLGGFYIYNLVQEDNLPALEDKKIKVKAPPTTKTKVLRLEPIVFYTIQAGIFPDENSTQDSVNKLVELGFSPFVTSATPYKIWVGCFSGVDSGQSLVLSLKNHGFEAFVGKGLINDRSLKFPGDNKFMTDKFAPLLGKYDLMLNHSLKMFQSPGIGTYKPDVWESMVKKIQDEVLTCIKASEETLQLPEASPYNTELIKLKEKAQGYNMGLSEIITLGNDHRVLYSQNNLLELIAAYHNLINQTNLKLNPNI